MSFTILENGDNIRHTKNIGKSKIIAISYAYRTLERSFIDSPKKTK